MSARLIPSLRDRMVVEGESARCDATDRIPGLVLKADVISSGDWRGIASHGDRAFITSGYPNPEQAMAGAFQGLVGA